MTDNLFTIASRLEESKHLVGYRVGWEEDGVAFQQDFGRDEIEEAERLMHEKHGWMTGIRIRRQG